MVLKEFVSIYLPMAVMSWMDQVWDLLKHLKMTLQNYVKKVSMHRLHLVAVACMSQWTVTRYDIVWF